MDKERTGREEWKAERWNFVEPFTTRARKHVLLQLFLFCMVYCNEAACPHQPEYSQD
jgi:hypothetical protein